MKTNFFSLATAGLMSAICLASAGDVGSILKQRARGMGERQSTPPAQPSAPPPPEAPAYVAPAVAVPTLPAAAKEKAVKALQDALDDIKPKTTATLEQKQNLLAALEGAAIGKTKPDKQALAHLAGALGAAWPTQNMEADEKGQLVKNLVSLMNAGFLPENEIQTTFKNTETILKYSGMRITEVGKMLDGLKKIVTELQRR